MQPVAGEEEIPLTGGMVSTVVRVGDTVRRPLERWSDAVHGVLRHLQSVGFDGAPRFLGVDDENREVLSWIPGTPASRPWPPALLHHRGVERLGRLLRRYHDAVAGYDPPPNAEWWTGPRRPQTGEVIRHGDLGPWNQIWRDGEPVAFIDWDFAEPGPPVRDLAEMAFFVTPMRDDDHCLECGFTEPPDRARRLQVLCDAYGSSDLPALLDAVDEFWAEDSYRIATFGPQGIKPWDGFLGRGLLEENQQLITWLRQHREMLVT